MILSMTGFGRSVAELQDKKVNVEVRSLNSKALDLTTRMATLYREKEMEVRTELSQLLERGKVDFTLWIEQEETVQHMASVNKEAVMGYYRQICEISEATGIPVPSDWFSTLLRMPDVLDKTECAEFDEEEWGLVHTAIREAADRLTEFRRQEGEALEKKLRENIANIGRLLAEVEPYEKERICNIKERIQNSLEQHLQVEYDKNRFEQELIFYIEKLDISEEKQRLANHLNYFITTMEGQPGQGKKLGFIAQEMGREINTLGSKSNQAEMQNLVVQMKDELEQIKEQVLNIM